MKRIKESGYIGTSGYAGYALSGAFNPNLMTQTASAVAIYGEGRWSGERYIRSQVPQVQKEQELPKIFNTKLKRKITLTD